MISDPVNWFIVSKRLICFMLIFADDIMEWNDELKCVQKHNYYCYYTYNLKVLQITCLILFLKILYLLGINESVEVFSPQSVHWHENFFKSITKLPYMIGFMQLLDTTIIKQTSCINGGRIRSAVDRSNIYLQKENFLKFNRWWKIFKVLEMH